MNAPLSQPNEFLLVLQTQAARYGVELDDEALTRLSAYYDHVMSWNRRLHLVAPCPPSEFATRHMLESLIAVPHFPPNARVADVGSGAGLPIIPCLIMRADLRATLIESSAKKSIFLREALRRIVPQSNAVVINSRFETTTAPEVDVITCRALDRFIEQFPALIKWSPPSSTLLFFGGPSLHEQIEAAGLSFSTVHLPASEQRYLFIIKRAT